MRLVTALICHNSEFLLFHRDEVPGIADPGCWQLPGGYMEKGESPAEAIKRELEEEVSYCPNELTLVGVKTYPNGNKLYFFFANVVDSEVNKFKLGHEEGQGLGFFDIDQALKIKLTDSLKGYIKKYKQPIKELLSKGELTNPEKFDLELVGKESPSECN